jgi:tetratricopeptide (TPR) repeat protein
MSLLLEALKKAERAKEEAQRRAQGDGPGAAADAPAGAREAQLESSAAAARDRFPDVRRPLEIVSDEPQAGPAEAELELTQDKPQPTAAPQASRPSAAQAADRAAARKVFEAKFREPNPRLPFFIALGALGVFALGAVVYFWLQLRPPAPLVNLNPKPQPGSETPVAAAAPARPLAPAPASASNAIPGLPSAPSASASPKPAAQPPAQQPPAVRQTAAPRVEVPRLQPPLRRPEPQPEISASRSTPQVHPKVGSAYAAYLANDLATARADYQQALKEEPANRDALLGLAALDVRSGRLELAEAAYLRLLQIDPRDAHAQAGLISLRTGRVDPVAAESRVKSMLADNPSAHVLYFTLGNQFAQQGRWAEAQAEYFKAFAAEPDNPDFAYNLAVSLDHLRQPQLALQYYQRALELAKVRGASFDIAAAQNRTGQLPALKPFAR